MTDLEKIDTLISEIKKLRESIDILTETLDQQPREVIESIERAPILTIVSAKTFTEEEIDGARLTIFPGTIEKKNDESDRS